MVKLIFSLVNFSSNGKVYSFNHFNNGIPNPIPQFGNWDA